ncbi:MAG: hypothetical protein VKI42_02195 [Synechococcaceae cyanobacterium]|nr:hypothetical protein [Synechococcaceae cyanobacterium]
MLLPLRKNIPAFAAIAAAPLMLLAPQAKAGLLVNIFDALSPGPALKITVQGQLDSLPPPLAPPHPDYASCGIDGLLTTTSICTGPDNTLNLNLYPVESTIAEIPMTTMGIGPADSVSGHTFALLTENNLFPHNASGIIFTYMLGSPFHSSATFNGQSLSSIGLAPGLVGVWHLTGTSEKIVVFAGPVPGPLPVLGAASALGLSRRLRKRIHSSRPID